MTVDEAMESFESRPWLTAGNALAAEMRRLREENAELRKTHGSVGRLLDAIEAKEKESALLRSQWIEWCRDSSADIGDLTPIVERATGVTFEEARHG